MVINYRFNFIIIFRLTPDTVNRDLIRCQGKVKSLQSRQSIHSKLTFERFKPRDCRSLIKLLFYFFYLLL